MFKVRKIYKYLALAVFMNNYKKILLGQKEELKDKLTKEAIIAREGIELYRGLISSKLVKVITGIRRCGKSVFSAQLLENKEYGYINFDDENLAGIEADKLEELLKTVYEVYGKIDYLFLDEIQNVNRWELFVNRLQRQNINLIVTGSNAKLLSKELATHLTGRHMAFELFPFSFIEFLMYKNMGLKAETTKEIGLIKNYLNEYIDNGGFPETFKEPNPKIYLKELYSTIIFKDILSRHKIRYAKTFRDLAIYTLTNFAKEVSFNKLKNIFNLGSDHTVKNYLNYLEESYLVFYIEKFSYKKKESLMENRKIYSIDSGLIKAISFRFMEDTSRIYENVVAIELMRKKSLDKNIEIFYWKSPQQEETDFIIKEGLRIKKLIQVCYDISDPDTKNREVRGLIKASKELRCNNLLVITEDKEGEEEIEWFGTKRKVKYVPLWKWLIEKETGF